ncbi:hypothetical protein DEO72_LG5g10 [Vigna unguiculata]|uniref:Uncharacterized protein n=1 Tax=Vigna unguiculata TaxID=3917 RepID=A0A4D6LTQ4_VIGUN|nr:hypothetical protein DEO72_LG5g10 [Vigna unguiculata]
MRVSKDAITLNGAMKKMWMKGMQLLEDKAKRLLIWRKPGCVGASAGACVSGCGGACSIQFVEQNVSRTKPGLFFLFMWVRKPQRLSSSWVVCVIRWISNLLLWGDCSVEGGKNNKEWGKTILGEVQMRVSKDAITLNGAMKKMWMKGMQLLEDKAKRLLIWRKP